MKSLYNITHIDTSISDLCTFKSVCMEHSENIRVDSFSDVDEALDSLQVKRPDILVLEIDLGAYNGLDLLQELRYSSSKVVFVTSNPDYATAAFNCKALHYLPKPFTARALSEILRRFKLDNTMSEIMELRNIQLSSPKAKALVTSRIFVNHEGKIHTVRACDILYMQAEDNGTMIYVKDGRKLKSSLEFRWYIKEFTGHPDLVILNNACLVSKKCFSANTDNAAPSYTGTAIGQTVQIAPDAHYAVNPPNVLPRHFFNRI